MRARYILLKDTPELKKGAVLEEECDEGNQGFECITPEHFVTKGQRECHYNRLVVTTQPQWFEKVSLLWLTKNQIDKVKKLLKI